MKRTSPKRRRTQAGKAENPPAPPDSPVASRTRRQAVLQAPLQEAVGPEGGRLMIKVPFTISLIFGLIMSTAWPRANSSKEKKRRGWLKTKYPLGSNNQQVE